MSFPPHASYKDSGVEWLGEVPSSWDVRRLRFVAALNPSRNEVAELPDDVELSFIPMEAVGEEGELDLSRTRPLGEVRNGYSYFADGDVVFAKVTPCLENGKGALMRNLVGAKGFGTTELTVLRPTSPEDGRFLWWLTKAPEFRGPASGEMIGAGGLKRVPDDFVANFAAPWPPAQDRQSIADFLDRETAKIDALAEAQRRLIVLLKEKRQAVISHAVTKGLDPSAPLRPSGIPWLGDVPAHWPIVPLRSLFRFVKRQYGDELDVLSVYRDYGVIRKSERDDNLNKTPEDIGSYQTVRPGDLVINKMKSWQGSLGISEVEGITSPDYAVFASTHQSGGSYLNNLLRCSLLPGLYRSISNGVRPDQWRLEPDRFRELKMPLPPREEQGEIADWIGKQTERLDHLAAAAGNAVEMLQERRAALISAAVTGKIDVRGWTAEQVRNAVGAEIVHLHARDHTFGRVQNQKLLFLAQTHAHVAEIGGSFQRQAAGPHDAELMSCIEQALKAEGVLQVSQPGGAGSKVTYTVTRGTRPDRARLRAMLGARRLAMLDQLLTALADLDTRGVEAVATLYGVWNDALLDGETPPGDDRLVRGFLKEWHPKKSENFRPDEVRNWIGFMRRNGLVPEGRGSHTQAGALL